MWPLCNHLHGGEGDCLHLLSAAPATKYPERERSAGPSARGPPGACVSDVEAKWSDYLSLARRGTEIADHEAMHGQRSGKGAG